jgi:hypothetical protein
MNMSKINKILIIVLVVIVIVLAGLLVWQKVGSTPSYYAVYLRTGDVYFGRLVRFPAFGLSHIYTLQANQNDKQNPFSVQKFSNVFWGPEDFMQLNREEVVWIVKLKADSSLTQLFTTNPELTVPATSQGAQTESSPEAAK